MLGPIKSDPCNINDIRSDWIRSDVDDVGSNQIGSVPGGDHGDRTSIPSGSPEASLDRDPGLAAEAPAAADPRP